MYLTIKALHIIAVVAWFAGLFYIFRLFVYHRANSGSNEIRVLLSVMERKLLYYITLPASIAVALFGLTLLVLNPSVLSQSWLWFKLGLVAILFGYQAFSFQTYRRFKNKDFFLSERQCRLLNEVPTIPLILIVLFAVRKSLF